MVLTIEHRVNDNDPSRASVIGTCTLTEVVGGHTIEWRGSRVSSPRQLLYHPSARTVHFAPGIAVDVTSR